MSEWQPIETAPKDGRQIDLWAVSAEYEGRLPYCRWTKFRSGRKDEYFGWENYEGFRVVERPTHWMELPDAPPGREWFCPPDEEEAA